MHRTSFLPALLLFLFLTADGARADGLFYALPKDGSSASYSMVGEIETNGIAAKVSGTFLMASVGKADVFGEPARWIEIRADQPEPVIGKLLVKEKFLKRGENVFDNFEQAFVKFGNKDTRKITDVTDPLATPLRVVFPGSLTQTETLAAEKVESGIGELLCKGEKGILKTKWGENEAIVTFKNRFHDKSPFGLLQSDMHVSIEAEGQKISMRAILTLQEIGKDEKSAIQDGQ